MAGTAAGGSRRNPIAPYLLVAPGILWLLAFYVIPTLTLARTSVGPEGAAWYDGYQRAFTDYGVHLGGRSGMPSSPRRSACCSATRWRT